MVVKEENQYAGAQDPKAGDKTVQQSRKQGILLEILERICKGKENIAKKINFPNPFPVLACLRKQNSEQSCKSGPVTEAGQQDKTCDLNPASDGSKGQAFHTDKNQKAEKQSQQHVSSRCVKSEHKGHL